MATSLPGDLPANLKSIQPYLEMANESADPCIGRLYALKQGFILKRVEEDLSFLLNLMKVLGENKQELKSRIEVNDIPVARAHLEGVVQKLLNWAENAPPLILFTNVVTKAFHSAGILLDVCSIFGEPSEDQAEKKKYTHTHGANLHSDELSENLGGISRKLMNDEKKKNGSLSTSFARNDCENRKSRKVTEENEGKKIYDRLFLLKLQNHPASQKRPDGLPSLEIVRDRMGRNKMIAGKLLDVHQQPQPRSFGAANYFGDRLSLLRLPNLTSSITNTKPQISVVPPLTTAQPRESSGASRRARSSALRIVDPTTDRDVLTGEEIPPCQPWLD